MVIEIIVEELVNTLRSTSHLEVAEIPDVEARYRAEAGSEKMDVIYRCVEEGARRLAGRCARYLKEGYRREMDDVMAVPTSYLFDLSLSERRAVNKAEPLTEAFHTFVVEYALAKFYSNVSQTELSNRHSLLALDAGNVVEELLYTKQPPRV